MSRRIGLLGGSFNPVHNGHLMLASYISQFGPVDEVWLVLSPCSPFKINDSKASDSDRLEMLKIAVGESKTLKVCDIELHLPRPSYTISTLEHLSKEYPDYSFVPIIGGDNVSGFSRWKDSDRIINDYGLILYPRKGFDSSAIEHRNVEIIDAPEIEISSTFIRECIGKGYDMNFFLPEAVYEYIIKNGIYKPQKNGQQQNEQ